MIRPRVAMVSLLVVASLQAQPTTAQEACGFWRDEGVVMAVQSRLQFSKLWQSVGNVVVKSSNCIVTLTGTVPTQQDSREVERIAAATGRVRQVRNELRVAAP
jgi:osmotically-inducible protein OsmY